MGKHESLNFYQAKLHEQFFVDPIGPDEIVLQEYTDSGQTGINVFADGLRLSPKVSIAPTGSDAKCVVHELMDKANALSEPICNACPFHPTECDPGLHNGIENGVVVLYVRNDTDAPLPEGCNIYNPSNPTSP